jgi:peptidoglycan/LPS O-acetylase OafA/YrhL
MNNQWRAENNNFDFLRLFLAITVIFSHSYPIGLGSNNTEPLYLLTHGVITTGEMAVDMFFFMSGFLISSSAEHSRSIVSYFRKRIARIYPAFIATTIFTSLIVIPIASGRYQGKRGAYLLDLLFQTSRLRTVQYENAFPNNPFPHAINGSLWSIQYEFWCYIGVACLFCLGLFSRRKLVLTFFIASIVISVAFKINHWMPGGKILGEIFGPPFIWARLLPFYLSGVVFYLFRHELKSNIWLALACLVILVSVCRSQVGFTALFPIAGSYLFLCIALAQWIPLHNLGKYGDFSYGTYLYAFPIQQVLMVYFGATLTPLLLFISATPLTLFFAVLSWYGIERRFLRKGRQKDSLTQILKA